MPETIDHGTVTLPPDQVPGSFGEQARGVPVPPPGVAGDAPTSPPPYLQKYGEKIEGLSGEDAKARQDYEHALAKPKSALDRIYSTPPPAPPTQLKPQDAPNQAEFQKDAMAFASAMAVLGAVSSRFARVPGTAALSAFGASLQGWQSGNQQAYTNAVKEWEMNYKKTIENNRQVLERYRMILENRKLNIDEQMSQMQLAATQYQDKLMYDATQAKNYTLAANIYEKQWEYTNGPKGIAETGAKLQAKVDAETASNKWKAARWASPEGQMEINAVNADGTPKYTEAQKAAVRQTIELWGPKQQAGGYGTDTDARSTAKLIAEGRIPPLSGYAMRSPFGQHVNNILEKEYPDYTPGKYQGTVAAARVETSAEPMADRAALTQLVKQKAAINSFENTAIKNGEVLKQLADKVDQTGIPAIERWIRAGRQSSGDPDVAKFHAQMQLYRAEVAKILTNPNLSGVLTDTARREVEGFMGGGASAQQIRAVVDLLRQDFGRRSQSIDEEITNVRSHLHGGGGGGAAPPATGNAPAAGAGAADPLGIR